MCFIYASLLEFVCVNYVGRKRPLHNVVYRPGENPVTQVNTNHPLHSVSFSLTHSSSSHQTLLRYLKQRYEILTFINSSSWSIGFVSAVVLDDERKRQMNRNMGIGKLKAERGKETNQFQSGKKRGEKRELNTRFYPRLCCESQISLKKRSSAEVNDDFQF
jgi:hypothetical protein